MTTSNKPNVSMLLQHPAHFFAFGLGSGLAAKAPGTFGSLVGLPFFWLISVYALSTQFIIIAALFLLGIYFCQVTGDALGVPDHGSIVWDEIVAMMLVLTVTPNEWHWTLTAFSLFRLFDIWKPYPIRQLDRRFKNGLGVMLDDLLAAVYAMLSVQLLMQISHVSA